MADPFDDVRTADAGGLPLAYREQGAGEPVVLIHGTASDLRSWTHQLPELGRHHRVIAYSRRFARPNPDVEPGADDPLLAHVDDLLRFLDAVDARPAHLVGHSWGGLIALYAAMQQPDSVRSLVLLEPPALALFGSTPLRPAELARLLFTRPRSALALVAFGARAAGPAQAAFRRGDDEAGIRAFGCGVLGTGYFERLRPEELAETRENVGSARAQLLGEGFPPLSEQDLRSVHTPALLLHGAESPALFRRLGERLAELLPRARRVEIPHASHRMQADAPQAVNAAILDFLAKGGGADA